MNQSILHYYRAARDWQRTVIADGGGMITSFTDGTASQLSYASAPYGEHALSALASAKGQISFRARLSASVKAGKKSSAAAKRGWKTRRGQQQPTSRIGKIDLFF